MKILILSNGQFIEKSNYKLENVVASISSDKKRENLKEYDIIDIHKDIIIKSNNKISLSIPIVDNNKKVIIDIVIDKYKVNLYYYNENLIEFLREKISLHKTIDKNMIFVFILQYFSYSYNKILLKIEKRLDHLFESALEDRKVDNKEILSIKKKVANLKRLINYYKTVLTYLDDELSELDSYDKTLLVLDNTLSLIENVESSIYSCIDIYNSELSNVMNRNMHILTIITMIPLPVTIISGIYGMNFKDMPFLNSEYGFMGCMISTLLIIILELIYFKKKKYI